MGHRFQGSLENVNGSCDGVALGGSGKAEWVGVGKGTEGTKSVLGTIEYGLTSS